MIRSLLRTNDSLAPFFLRLAFGGLASWRGLESLAGAAFGEGPTPYLTKLASGLNVPELLALPAVLVLTLGGVLLVLGWTTRLLAPLILAVLACQLATRPPDVATYGWLLLGADPRVGMMLLLPAVSVSLMITGGGRLSLDRMATRPGKF